MVITALTRNQVYRQRYRGFESHPLRQKKAHPPGWAFFWHYDPGAGGIRKAALGGMPVACRNRRGFSAEKGSHPLRHVVADYASSRRLFYAAHEKVISHLLRCSSLQNRDRFAGSRFCFCGRDRPRCSRKKAHPDGWAFLVLRRGWGKMERRFGGGAFTPMRLPGRGSRG